MTISAVFKSPIPSFTYHYKNGMTAVFINGRYETDNEALARELFEEVGAVGRTKSRNPYIFIDEDEQQVDSEALTPMEIIRQQAYEQAKADLLAEQTRALDASANVSNTKAENFAQSLGNSNTIAEVTNNTTSASAADVAKSVTAKLADLKVSK